METKPPVNSGRHLSIRRGTIWEKLTRPSERIQDVTLRRKANLLSGLLLLGFVVQTLAISFRLALMPSYHPVPSYPIILMSAASLYLLSRTHYYQITAVLTILYFPIGVFILIVNGASPIPEFALLGLMLSLLLGSLLLSLPNLVILGIFNIAAAVIVFWLMPDHVPNMGLVLMIISFYAIAVVLTIASRHLHQQLEQDRLLALKESEERFRQLAENIQEVFWISQPNETLEYVSPTVEQVWGRPASDFYQNPAVFLQSIHPDDREEIVKPMSARQASGEQASNEYRIVWPDGTIRWIWDRGFPLKDEAGQVYRVMGIAADITERKQSEQQLRDSEKLLKTIAEHFPRAYLSVINADLTIGFTRGQEFKRYQLDPNNYVGLHVRDVFGVYGEAVVERVIAAYHQTFAGQAQFFELTLEEEHLTFETVPLLNEQGKIQQILAVVQNDTERKRAEATLRQSEERFSKVFSASPDALFLTRMRDGYIVDVNNSVERLFGYSRAELIGHSTLWMNLYANPDDRSKLVQFLQQQGSLRDYEVVVRIKSGKLRTVTISIELIELEGEPHMISLIRDITEQKRVEAQLVYHAYILENLAEGVQYVDDQGIIHFTNPAFDDMFGYDRNELIGQHISIVNDLPPAESQAFVAEILGTLQRQGLWEGEIRNRRKDGTSLITRAKIQTLTLGEQSYWVTFQEDISERKRAEEALRENEARYRALYNNSPVMMHSIDSEGRLISVSDYWLERMGYERAEVIGQVSLNFLTRESRQYALQVGLPQFIKTGYSNDIPLRFVKKNGELIDILLSAVAEYNEAGKFERSMAVMVDVTERNQLEAELRQAQKMEAIGQLTAGIAHDFNNLLLVIRGFAQLVRLEMGSDHPLVPDIDKILHSSQLASNLINQLMIFSHKQIVEPEVINLNEVVKLTEKLLRRIIGEHINLTAIISSDLWSVKADRSQLEQVIVNLAVNARDAMPHGGQLIIETANTRLDEKADGSSYLQAEPGEYVLLTISDTGVGMNQAVQTRIFEPFFTTKERGHGTGLGLATVYGIVKQNDGDIRVDSETGQGTTFKVYLPRAAEGAPSLAVSENLAQVVQGGSETILLTEDDDEVRNLVSSVLRLQGYQVLEARDGQEALQLATHHSTTIDLLFTDVIMPGSLHGQALAERLGQHQPNLKVIYMSGYGDEEIAHHGVLNPGVAFLQKPFNLAAMVQKIRQVLDVPARR